MQNLQDNYFALKNDYRQKIQDISDDIRILYDEYETLPQLIYLKENLQLRNKIDNFIMAILTGIMHRKHREDGTSMYCSIDMPNTFSMSPNYIRNFIENYNLLKIKQDVFKLIQERLERLKSVTKPYQKLEHYQKVIVLKKMPFYVLNKLLKNLA